MSEPLNPEEELVLRTFLHDIRNPLSAIVGFAHLLQVRDDKLSPEQREKVIESLNRTAERLSDLVDRWSVEQGLHRDESS